MMALVRVQRYWYFIVVSFSPSIMGFHFPTTPITPKLGLSAVTGGFDASHEVRINPIDVVDRPFSDALNLLVECRTI